MKKILIIEDDPIIGHIYKTRLEKDGYQTEVCADGQDGFYKIHEFKPDAVLLDLMLPKINGLDILKKIRAQAQFKQLPIFVFTNAYVPNMVEEVNKAGATRSFNKACVTPREIGDAIKKALSEEATAAVAPTAPGPETNPTTPKEGVTPPNPAREPAIFSNPATVIIPPPGTAIAGTNKGPDRPAVEPARSTESVLGCELGLIGSNDAQSQNELLNSFKSSTPEYLGSLRRATQEFVKSQDDSNRLTGLLALYRKVHALSGAAGIVGLRYLATITTSLEALLIELHQKPKNINASTIRTVAHSIDLIGDLLKSFDTTDPDLSSAKILVVDDEILSCRAILYALEKADLRAMSVESPQIALQQAMTANYDLIFLDVMMPELDGFDLCTKIRAGESNQKTPIIFVTSLNDFGSRARSTLKGGTDLIAKPFLFIELAVKSLTYVLRSKLARRTSDSRAA